MCVKNDVGLALTDGEHERLECILEVFGSEVVADHGWFGGVRDPGISWKLVESRANPLREPRTQATKSQEIPGSHAKTLRNSNLPPPPPTLALVPLAWGF